MPRQKQRTPELRQHVVGVAVELLRDQGAAGLTTRSLAARAGTSAPAVYELFGDKAGVVHALHLEGFRKLAGDLSELGERRDPISDLWTLASEYRRFIRSNRELSEVMFSRPFVEFSPGPDELAVTNSVGSLIGGLVRRCIEAGRMRGDEADICHLLEALLQGMAFAETAGRLGTSTESIERRWRLAIGAILNGFGVRESVERVPAD